MHKRMVINGNWIIFLMFMFSSLVVIQFSGRTLFLIMQILFCFLMILIYKKIVFLEFPVINLITAEIIISALSAILGDMRISYKKSAIVLTVYAIILYFTAAYLYKLIKEDRNIIAVIVTAIKAMCLIQLVWIPLQYFSYHFLNIDINDIIFNRILHFMDNPSFFRDWVYYPSGFTWHSAVLAPMFVLAFILFHHPLIKILVIIDSVICGNSTALAGMFICIALLGVFYLLENRIKIRINIIKFIIMMIVVMAVIAVVYKTGIINSIIDRVSYLFIRVLGIESDASTSAHFSYFTDYPKMLKISSPFQIMFGYGEGCSGYLFTALYNRYDSLSSWALECDIMNILLSRGVVGFITYYYFLFYICLKGLKIDYRYFVVMFPIILQGIGYNVQWDYVYLIEIILYITIKMNVNFFDLKNNSKTFFRIS